MVVGRHIHAKEIELVKQIELRRYTEKLTGPGVAAINFIALAGST